MAHAHTSHAPADKYYVPHSSWWPIVGSISLFTTMVGVALWLNHVHAGPWVLTAGFALLIFMFFGWFGDVIKRERSAQLQQRRSIARSAWG